MPVLSPSTVSDNLDLATANLVTFAKKNGSTDNITIVIVFLRAIDELAERANATKEKSATLEDATVLDVGITSTCRFIANRLDPYERPDNMNGDDADPMSAAAAAGQLASPMLSGGETGSAFDSPMGGGSMFSDSPDPFASAVAKNGALETSSDDFKRASPSMFDQPFDSDGERNSGSGVSAANAPGNRDEVDFMANQEQAWIHASSGAGAAGAHANFLLNNKSDSGFISPARSNNQSASSEDSAENHAERQASPESVDIKKAEDEDEEAESREVSKLLASAGGAPFDLLQAAKERDTPTPEMEENGKQKRILFFLLPPCFFWQLKMNIRFHGDLVGLQLRNCGSGNYTEGNLELVSSLRIGDMYFNADIWFRQGGSRTKHYRLIWGN